MDFFELLVNAWLWKKEADSKTIAKAQAKLREPLPNLGNAPNGHITLDLAKAVNAQCGKLGYKLDPLGGISDYYNHPETTQWRLNTGNTDLPCDCDDFAVYAMALFLKAGVARDQVWIWNLIIDPMSQFSQAWANHVICGFRLEHGGKIWTGVIDTNTAARKEVFWYQANKTLSQTAVIQQFRDIYAKAGKQANYYKLVEAGFPF